MRKAYRVLAQSLTLTPYTARDCSNINYNRLDREYRLIHQLCRFFIDRAMPNYDSGNYQSLPFLIDMAKLYEQFVAEQLKINLPAKYQLKIKETVKINPIKLEIDLLICDRFTGKTLYVLDTKYKTPQKPSNADIYQLVAYDTSQKCDRAILIYPQLLPKPLNTYIGEINVRSLTFSLQEDLEKSGMAFMESF